MELSLLDEQQVVPDDGEISWPQCRRSERGRVEGRLSLTDLNLHRLAGVPRAHEMPSQVHEPPSSVCYNQSIETPGDAMSWPASHETPGDAMSWPAAQPLSMQAEAMEDTAGLSPLTCV